MNPDTRTEKGILFPFVKRRTWCTLSVWQGCCLVDVEGEVTTSVETLSEVLQRAAAKSRTPEEQLPLYSFDHTYRAKVNRTGQCRNHSCNTASRPRRPNPLRALPCSPHTCSAPRMHPCYGLQPRDRHADSCCTMCTSQGTQSLEYLVVPSMSVADRITSRSVINGTLA